MSGSHQPWGGEQELGDSRTSYGATGPVAVRTGGQIRLGWEKCPGVTIVASPSSPWKQAQCHDSH